MSPATWMFRSYWSVQNQGGSLYSLTSPIMLAATEIAWFWALAQVSTRIARPWQRLHCRAASPAQNTPDAAVRPQASTAIPPCDGRPSRSATVGIGVEPVPTVAERLGLPSQGGIAVDAI